jgi:hypothetical protein
MWRMVTEPIVITPSRRLRRPANPLRRPSNPLRFPAAPEKKAPRPLYHYFGEFCQFLCRWFVVVIGCACGRFSSTLRIYHLWIYCLIVLEKTPSLFFHDIFHSHAYFRDCSTFFSACWSSVFHSPLSTEIAFSFSQNLRSNESTTSKLWSLWTKTLN